MNEQPGLSVKTEIGIHRCNSVIYTGVDRILFPGQQYDSTYHCIAACTSSLLIKNVCFVSETAFLIYLVFPARCMPFKFVLCNFEVINKRL